jgi:AraC family transcriptional regulator
MQEDKLERWKTRFAKAAKLLSERLDDPPPLEELAAAAAISPFHFHRIWRALTGETVRETVLRLRIEVSQQLLASGGANVTQIAMASGFGTPQSFARAFRRQTGVTPTAYRQGVETADGPPGEPLVEIVERGETLVVSLRHQGPYNGLAATYQQVFDWAGGAGLLSAIQGIYGIPLDVPDEVAETELRYEACLALGKAEPPEPFTLLALPSGPTAKLRHFGSYEGLDQSAQLLVEEWLLPSGREPGDHPIYQNYLNDPDNTPEAELITDLYLPLKA